MNKAIITGNLVRDPELSETTSGTAYCKFSIAVSRPYTNGDGNREADFFTVVAWRALAENCGRYLKKGRKVAVVGSIQNRQYEGKDGLKRTVTEIIAQDVEFLSGGENTADNGERKAQTATAVQQKIPTLTETDDDLPF